MKTTLFWTLHFRHLQRQQSKRFKRAPNFETLIGNFEVENET